MNDAELREYRTESAYDDDLCFLCGKRFRAGEQVLRVPTHCGETEKMRAGAEYQGLHAHEACLRRVP